MRPDGALAQIVLSSELAVLSGVYSNRMAMTEPGTPAVAVPVVALIAVTFWFTMCCESATHARVSHVLHQPQDKQLAFARHARSSVQPCRTISSG